MSGPPTNQDASEAGRQQWALAGLGTTLGSEIAAGVLIGWGLDWLLGTGPILLVICTILGVLVGMVHFVASARAASTDAAAESQRLVDSGAVAPLPLDQEEADGDGDGDWDLDVDVDDLIGGA